MRTTEIILISLGLSMDALAVAVASGATMKRLHLPHALKMGLFFGGFQALMPVLGWLAGLGMKSFISGVDHWIAAGLLSLIGGKMLYGSFFMREESGAARPSPFDTGTLTMLAIATSIDALAVGVTFSVLSVSILSPSLAIGAVTFVMSMAGVRIGAAGGHFFERRMEAAGGVILVALGLKILFEHLGMF